MSRGAAAALLAALLGTATATAAPDDGARIEAAIREVLAAPEFQRTRTETVTRLRDRGKEEPSQPAEARAPPDPGFGRLLARITEVVLWTLAIVAVVALAMHYRRLLPALRPPRRAPPRPATAETSIRDAARAALPEDVAGAARDLLHAGRPREALALLYRAALERLAQRYALARLDAATEAECLRAVRAGAGDDDAHYFADLCGAWQRTAYAGRPPARDATEELCTRWRQRFEGAA